MNKLWFAALLLFIPVTASAATDYLLEIDGVKGEVKASSDGRAATESAPARVQPTTGATPTTVVQPTSTPQAAKADVFLELDGVKGETNEPAPKKSKVDAITIKQSALQGVEPDEIDFDGGDQPITPDLAILLGGGDDESDEANNARNAQATILLNAMQAAGKPVETMSLNYGKIKMTMMQPVRLFGFLPISARVGVEMNADAQVRAHFPWWTLFATGDEPGTVGELAFSAVAEAIQATREQLLK